MIKFYEVPKLSYRVYYVWLRNLYSYRRFIVSTIIGNLGEPVIYLIAMGVGIGSYMKLTSGEPYLNFIAPGLVVSSVMFASVYECTFGSFLRMIHEKIYSSIVSTPISTDEVIMGDILWGTTKAVLSGMIMFLVVMLFGIGSFVKLFPIILLMLLVGFLFSSMALIVTALAPNFDFFTYFLTLFVTPMFFFSGIFFPLDEFPNAVKVVSSFLPLTKAANISRFIMQGSVLNKNVLYDTFILIVWGLILYCAATLLIRKRLIK